MVQLAPRRAEGDTSEVVDVREATAADKMAVAEVHVRSWQQGCRGLVAQGFLDGCVPRTWPLETHSTGWTCHAVRTQWSRLKTTRYAATSLSADRATTHGRQRRDLVAVCRPGALGLRSQPRPARRRVQPTESGRPRRGPLMGPCQQHACQAVLRTPWVDDRRSATNRGPRWSARLPDPVRHSARAPDVTRPNGPAARSHRLSLPRSGLRGVRAHRNRGFGRSNPKPRTPIR